MGKVQAIGALSRAVSKVGGKALMKCKKASPELLLVGGLVVGVAALIAACCETRKVDEVIEDCNRELDDIQDEIERQVEEAGGEVEEIKVIRKNGKKRCFKVYIRMAGRLLRLYLPAIALVLLSIGLLLGSHGVLRSRYLGTVAAYTTLDEAFKDYRRRIADIAGEEAEQRFYDGVEDVEMKFKDPETGEEKVVVAPKQTKEKKISPYEFDFNHDTSRLNWAPNIEHNYTFLRQVQSWMNDKLNAQGYLFLNDVLDGLGIDPTHEGQLLGWIKNSEDGDGYVDFGFSEYYTDDYCDDNMFNKNIHLNMNCDGIIWDKF